MGDLSGQASVEIAAPPERCFAIAADVERAPEWQGAMRSARALQRGAGGRPVLVETEIDALVAKVTLLLRFDYDEPHGLAWAREGGDLKGLDGAWRFAPRPAAPRWPRTRWTSGSTAPSRCCARACAARRRRACARCSSTARWRASSGWPKPIRADSVAPRMRGGLGR